MERMHNRLILVISAPSGAGKTTIIRAIMEKDPRVVFSVSTTTRQKRGGEIEGKTYYFTDDESFREMAARDEFLEWAHVHTNYYGTTKKEVDRIMGDGNIPVFDVDVQGAKNLRTRLTGAVFVFIMPPSLKVLSERLVGRNTEGKAELSVRLSNAVVEMREYAWYDYVVVNNRLEDAVGDILSIIRAEELSRDSMRETVERIMEDSK
jgi:guanylate kinase